MDRSEQRFSFNGKGGELFVTYLVNGLLTVVTFGVYAFWGRVKVTGYLYNHTGFLGRNFDFHGTGKEQFVGFLIGVFCLGAAGGVYAGLAFLFINVLQMIWPAVAVTVVFALALSFAIPFLLVGLRRYFLSRTSYNRIRFGFAGRVGELIKIFLPGVLLMAITGGIYYPWFRVKLEKFFTGGSLYGNQSFEYHGKGGELFGHWIKGYLITAVTLGIYGPWWFARMERYGWNRTSFMGNRFRLDITGGQVWGKFTLAILMTVFSGGIAFAWAQVMLLRWYLGALVLEGRLDLTAVAAAPDESASPHVHATISSTAAPAAPGPSGHSGQPKPTGAPGPTADFL